MTPVTLKDGSVVADIKLDRLVEFDERSREYPVSAAMPVKPALRTKTWDLPRRYFVDQGQEGACVSCGFGHDSAAKPYATGMLTMPWLREQVYWPAQRDDPWEGGSYPGANPVYEGTSVLSGAKRMQQLGFFSSYHWAFSIDEVLEALMTLGTVVFGLAWLDSMFEPRPSGLLEVSGSVAGGHCVSGRGVWLPNSRGVVYRLPGERLDEPVIVVPQSWGLDYGNKGEVYIKVSDLERLLKHPDHPGECCVPTERRKVNIRRLVV